MASRSPRSCSSAITRCVRSGSVIAADSVTSISTFAASRPCVSSSDDSCCTSAVCQSTGGRLTAISTSMPTACQALACANADEITQFEIGWIMPRRSAGGMKLPGAAQTLGERDEVARRDQTALRVVPADERLDADHAAGLQVEHRLVVEDELVAADRPLQSRCQRHPADRLVRAEAGGVLDWAVALAPRLDRGKRRAEHAVAIRCI